MATSFPENLFTGKTVTCPACGTKFTALQVRTIALRPRRKHSDFYTEYDGPNPAHYTVWVCPHCLYASYRYDFKDLGRLSRTNIRKDEAERKKLFGEIDFHGTRDLATVQASYTVAARCYRIRRSRIAMQAALHLHMAWLAREQSLLEEEKQYMELAREFYMKSYANERARTEKDEIKQTYFIGELSLRLGRYRESVRWFQETVKHPAIGEYPGLARRVRGRWADAREAARKTGR